MIRCFVPVYWPSVFLQFPEDVAVYFGADPKRSRTLTAKALWTLLVPALAYALKRLPY